MMHELACTAGCCLLLCPQLILCKLGAAKQSCISFNIGRDFASSEMPTREQLSKAHKCTPNCMPELTANEVVLSDHASEDWGYGLQVCRCIHPGTGPGVLRALHFAAEGKGDFQDVLPALLADRDVSVLERRQLRALLLQVIRISSVAERDLTIMLT